MARVKGDYAIQRVHPGYRWSHGADQEAYHQAAEGELEIEAELAKLDRPTDNVDF